MTFFSRHAELGELSHDCVKLFCCFRRDGWLITYCRFGRFVRECTKHFLCLGSSNCQQDGNLLLVFRSVFFDSCQIPSKTLQEPFPPISQVTTGYFQFMWWLQFVHLFGSFILNANSWYHVS
ncbi:hypothetical protein NP493_240g00020 [Ridgeia piscesae]|uniref:Uncharacterized protein n=1 Tax=Ridgeia piscesae TaxID=27915 RepID=A0AAD9UDE6_RIDPI|nr:hypothetical protein NP493_240g00020 [Ridgeia piscesae]